MTHLSGSENSVGTNRATAWSLGLLKRKMFATYFSRHKKSMEMQIYPADGHAEDRILPHKNRHMDHSLI